MTSDTKVPLTSERIVATAIVIADREELDAVTMRRVAGELGSGVMSLYRHIENHEDLVHQMCDRLALDYAYRDEGNSSWRAGLLEMSLRDWDMYTDHPWALPTAVPSGSYIGPNTLANYEWACRRMESTGLPLIEQHQIIMVLCGYVAGMAVLANDTQQASQKAGLSLEEWSIRQRQALARHTDHQRFPFFAQVLQDSEATNFEKFFGFGLRCVLDGIEARVRGPRLDGENDQATASG